MPVPDLLKSLSGTYRNRCPRLSETRTFKRMTRDAGLYEELHDVITGHANKGSVGRDYGRGFSIKPLAKAMAQIGPPVDLSGLAWRVP